MNRRKTGQDEVHRRARRRSLPGGKYWGFEVPVEPQDRSGDLLVE